MLAKSYDVLSNLVIVFEIATKDEGMILPWRVIGRGAVKEYGHRECLDVIANASNKVAPLFLGEFVVAVSYLNADGFCSCCH